MITRAVATMLAIAAGTALSGCGEKEADASTDAAETATAPTAQSAAETRRADPATQAAVAAAEPKTPKRVEVENPVLTLRGTQTALKLGRDDITMIAPAHDPDADTWSVFVQMDADASEALYDLTTSLEDSALSVVVEEAVVSAPKIESPIYGGGFVFAVETEDDANRIAAVLRGGKPEVRIVDVEPAEAEPAAESSAAAETPGETKSN